jgi:ParB family transcriptional regulator, chromosome partitioning protein
VRRGGLGRGLSALIPGAAEARGLVEVPVDAVTANPRQPRTRFDDDSLASLARSIQEVGVLQPIIVRSREGGYELIAGERRLRAARLAGIVSIPAIIRESEDAESLREAVIENVHREDLGPLELAAAFQELIDDLGVTQEAVAERLGFSRAHIANTIRLLSLPPDVQRLLADGRIQAGHGRALLGLPNEEARSSLALRTVAEGLSVRDVERLVRAYTSLPAHTRRPRARPVSMDDVAQALSEHLAASVQVTMGKRGGRIVVSFASNDDLKRLMDILHVSTPAEPPADGESDDITSPVVILDGDGTS